MNSAQNFKKGHITVALSVYNGEATVEKAVRSLLDQSYRDFELYVIEDGSTDRTFEILESILPEDDRMHVVRMAKNAGTYSAKNLILKHFCDGEFFAHQDADDFSWANRFEEQIKFMSENSEVAACGTGIDEFYKTEAEKPTILCFEDPVYNPEDGYFHRRNIYPPTHPVGITFGVCLDETVKTRLGMNGSLIFRSHILHELGGFDGRTPLAGDTDMLWRILATYPIANIQQVLYSRLFHKNSMTKSKNHGFGSELRTNYMRERRDWLESIKPLYEAGKVEELKQVLKRDLYVANIDFEVFDGGTNQPAAPSSIEKLSD